VAVTITFVFLVIHALPGSPVFNKIGLLQSPQIAAQLSQQLGLDRPILEQYKDFVVGLAHGDLGTSFDTSNPVTKDLLQVFPSTLELLLAGLMIGLIFGCTVGIIAGLRARHPAARAVSGYRLFAGSIPEFWLGLIFIYVFVAVLKIAPGPVGQLDLTLTPPTRITGMVVIDSALEGRWADLWSSLAHLALPALVLGLSVGGPIARLTRSMVAEVREADYIQYAQIVGLPRRDVIAGTARMAVPSLITLTAVLAVALLGGLVPIEVVFSWGGFGQYAVNAVQTSDYPAIQGVVIVATTFALVVYLLADILHALVDPRFAASMTPRSGLVRRRRKVSAIGGA
jgi:peptide/nickel transport system permease protein